ncbi:MAG: multi-sensor signal transduction histidine kinase [Geobacteraceae bacterium]|nr:multi-sensor signal transduction histidine kinase [Geobacteraceae bacterium]
MSDENKTRQQLLDELKESRQRNKDLEMMEKEYHLTSEALQVRLRHEKALADCSHALLKIGATTEKLTEALGYLLSATEVSRVYLFENFEDPEKGLCARQINEVCAKGVIPKADNPDLRQTPYKDGFRRWRNELSCGRPIRGLISSFPESERKILEPQGIQSILVLPVQVAGQWHGFIGFDDCHGFHDWSDVDVSLLSTGAEIIGSCIELKRAEITLLNNEEKFRGLSKEFNAILDTVPDSLTLQSPDLKIIWANRGAAARLSLKIDEIIGRECYRLWHQSGEPCRKCPVQRCFRNGEPAKENVTTPDGRIWELRAVPVKGENGRVVNVVEVAREITERKLAEQELKAKKAELEVLNRNLGERVREEVTKNREKDHILIQQSRQAVMGEMFGYIAHQWRQPLTVVSLLVQDIEECYTYANFTKDYLDTTVNKIIQLIQHMSLTIDDFRDFFKPDKVKTQFFVDEIVKKTLCFMEASLKYYEIAVDTNIETGLSVNGYPNEYSQVLLNILSNAKDVFIERKTAEPRISIKGFRELNKTVVTITDNAGGIDNAIKNRVFDPYFSTKNGSNSTGIGLYMSRIIIEKNMGGSLTARNVENGAEFRIDV